jgi:hypothetical protein
MKSHETSRRDTLTGARNPLPLDLWKSLTNLLRGGLRVVTVCVLAACWFGLAPASRGAESTAALNFVNDIEPILTKAGCNAGACHAKAGIGQRGFRLSVLGFEPQEDYEHIVKEGKGRRVFAAAPDQSLLLLKAANIVPHGGGKRIEPGSEEFHTVVRWISEGMAYQRESDPKIVSLEVEPARISLKARSNQQLKVRARYSDGGIRDVSRTALYEANDKSMAEASEEGLVTLQDLPGNVAVMVRYSGLVSVCSISVPLGAPVEQLPPLTKLH